VVNTFTSRETKRGYSREKQVAMFGFEEEEEERISAVTNEKR